MSRTKTLACHDCSAEIKIDDRYEELNATDLQFCPVCGSQNIEVIEPNTGDEEGL